MLTKIATQNEFDNVEFSVPQAEKVTLSVPQAKLVKAMRSKGGFVSKEEMADLADMRVLKVLLREEVVTLNEHGYVLNENRVEIKASKIRDHVSFAEALEEIFGYGGQTKLANIMGVNKNTVGKWVQGKLAVPQHAWALVTALTHCIENEIGMPEFE